MKLLHLLCLTVAGQTAFGMSPSFAADTTTSTQTVASARTAAAEQGEEEIQPPKNYGRASTVVSSSQCKINCTAPHAACSESAEVLKIVQDIYKSLSERDFDSIAKHLDANCTKFDRSTKQTIVGRDAIISDLKEQLEKVGPGSATPLLSYTIDHPYAHVSNDTAVVTFTAYKEFGGTHPKKYESRCTDIFKKEGNTWMKISYSSNWKETNL
ncbi:MAG TPA: nuclear transport factor 2 family protein [Oculatellaceae cyanobacterium]